MNHLYKLLFFVFTTLSVFADEAPLDPPYKDLIHPRIPTYIDKALAQKSEVVEMIKQMTPVKSQGHRGTCSIFATLGFIEGQFKILRQEDWDLSEEWLEYLAVRGSDDDGSTAGRNFFLLKQSGPLLEETWAYDPEEWIEGFEKAEKFCSKVKEDKTLFKSCLLVHRDPRLLDQKDEDLADEKSEFFDPEFLKIKKTAQALLPEVQDVFGHNLRYVYDTPEIKTMLLQGQPLLLGLDFYYGAWNHRLMTDIGAGERDMEAWSQGVVGYPARGSLDRELSVETKNRAGHAIVIVGFDDNVVVKTKVKMKNGKMKTFRYKGVYYFKNSWGTDKFGKDFVLDGLAAPGYGMITQKYAHEFGSFNYLQNF